MNEKVVGAIIGTTFLAGLFLVLGVPSILLYTYVLIKLWLWFLVPTLGLPPIGMAQGYGIVLLVGLLTQQQIEFNKKEDPTSSLTSPLTYALILLYGRPLLVLLFGWIATLFMN